MKHADEHNEESANLQLRLIVIRHDRANRQRQQNKCDC